MSAKPFANRNGGFTLIEILVSMVIGLLGIVVMFQVLKMWDSLKRTTAAGSDAQIAGTVAMFSLERDIRPAGMGFSKGDKDDPLVPSMGCKVWAMGPTPFFSLVPVQIVQGANGAPDQIITLYGSSSFFVSTQKYRFTAPDSKTVDGSFAGFKRGDVVIAGGDTAATDCELLEVSSDATPGVLGHTASSYVSYYTGVSVTARFNPEPSGVTLPATGFLYNLGPTPQRNIWSIQSPDPTDPTVHSYKNDGREKLYLQKSLDAADPTAAEVADNIINLQAQYGIDTNGNGKIEDDGTTTLCTVTNEWCEADPVAPADWAKVIAIRVALLSRSQQVEKIAVTPDPPTWAGGAFGMSNIVGATGDVADWHHYRYRVYEKVFPLRNMVWGGDFK